MILKDNIWTYLRSKLKTKRLQAESLKKIAKQEHTEIPCCSDKVHIAYRGLSDDHLYIAYNRRWVEVRYFKLHGLRVFCVQCRRRLI